MDMLQHLRRLFSYDAWANREVLVALQSQKVSPPRSMKLLAHILSAEKLWLERLLSQKQTYPVWPDFSLDQGHMEVAELPKLWKNYLGSLDEASLEASVTYKNTRGESWSSKRQDILQHVVMHSAYHRGQIAADMRAAGLTPATTDFIHAVRQELME